MVRFRYKGVIVVPMEREAVAIDEEREGLRDPLLKHLEHGLNCHRLSEILLSKKES